MSPMERLRRVTTGVALLALLAACVATLALIDAYATRRKLDGIRARLDQIDETIATLNRIDANHNETIRLLGKIIDSLSNGVDDHAAGNDSNFEVLWGLLASDRERLNALVVDFCRLYNYAHNGVETDDPGPD